MDSGYLGVHNTSANDDTMNIPCRELPGNMTMRAFEGWSWPGKSGKPGKPCGANIAPMQGSGGMRWWSQILRLPSARGALVCVDGEG